MVDLSPLEKSLRMLEEVDVIQTEARTLDLGLTCPMHSLPYIYKYEIILDFIVLYYIILGVRRKEVAVMMFSMDLPIPRFSILSTREMF